MDASKNLYMSTNRHITPLTEEPPLNPLDSPQIISAIKSLSRISTFAIILSCIQFISTLLTFLLLSLSLSLTFAIVIFLQLITFITSLLIYYKCTVLIGAFQENKEKDGLSSNKKRINRLIRYICVIILSISSHLFFGLLGFVFYSDTAAVLMPNQHPAILLCIGILELSALAAIHCIYQESSKPQLLKENSKYILECLALNQMLISLVVVYQSYYLWSQRDQLDFDMMLSISALEVLLISSLVVAVPIALLYYFAASNEFGLLLTALVNITYVLVVAYLILGVSLLHVTFEVSYAVNQDFNRFIGPIHQEDIKRFGCVKYQTLDESLFELQCSRELTTFAWEVNQYGCLNKPCCELIQAHQTEPIRLITCGFLSLAYVLGLSLFANLSLRRKISFQGQSTFRTLDAKILISMFFALGLTLALAICFQQKPLIYDPIKDAKTQVIGAGYIQNRFTEYGVCIKDVQLDLESYMSVEQQYLVNLTTESGQLYINLNGIEVSEIDDKSVSFVVDKANMKNIDTVVYCPTCPLPLEEIKHDVQFQIYQYITQQDDKYQGKLLKRGVLHITLPNVGKQDIIGLVDITNRSEQPQTLYTVKNADCNINIMDYVPENNQFQISLPLPSNFSPVQLSLTVQTVDFDIEQTVQLGGLPLQKTKVLKFTFPEKNEGLFKLEGKVLDFHRNQPVQRVQVMISPYIVSQAQPIIEVFTDIDGKFYTDSIYAGSYKVSAISAGYHTVSSYINLKQTESEYYLYLTPQNMNSDKLRVLLYWKDMQKLDLHLLFGMGNDICNVNFAYRHCGGSIFRGIQTGAIYKAQEIQLDTIGPYIYLLYVKLPDDKYQSIYIDDFDAQLEVFSSQLQQSIISLPISGVSR